MNARELLAVLSLFLGGYMPATAKGEGALPGTVTLRVEMTGFRNAHGTAKVALWRSRDGFPEDSTRAARRYSVPITDGKAVLVVDDLQPGPWAVAAFHDENDTGKIELGLMGIPKEGLGVSRDAKGFFGPPSFEAASLDLQAGPRLVRFKIFYY